jgi:hypothetical protein
MSDAKAQKCHGCEGIAMEGVICPVCFNTGLAQEAGAVKTFLEQVRDDAYEDGHRYTGDAASKAIEEVAALQSTVAKLREELAHANDRAAHWHKTWQELLDKYALLFATEKDAPAMRKYYVTAFAKGFVNSPLWHELSEQTRQLYRDAAIDAAKERV